MDIFNNEGLNNSAININKYNDNIINTHRSVRTQTKLKPLKQYKIGGTIVPSEKRLDKLKEYFDDKTLNQLSNSYNLEEEIKSTKSSGRGLDDKYSWNNMYEGNLMDYKL